MCIQSPFTFQHIEYEDTYQKTKFCEVVAKRGVYFHPTIGTTTHDRFTTGHPWDRPLCSERETLSSSSATVRDITYSPSPTWSWPSIFFVPNKEVFLSTFAVTFQHHLSYCNKTLPTTSYTQNDLISYFLLELEICNHSFFFSSWDWSFDSALFTGILYHSPTSSHKLPLSFIPQQGFMGPNPHLMMRYGYPTDGYSTPSPH